MSGRCKHREVEPGQDAGFWPCVATFWAEDKYNQKLACMMSARDTAFKLANRQLGISGS